MAKQGAISTLPLSEFVLAIFVLSLVLILLIELPPWMVDVSIALNMTLGIVLLMISLFVQKPLELASLPSIILVGTMFRLVLSIASTRLILARGEAGAAVEAPEAAAGKLPAVRGQSPGTAGPYGSAEPCGTPRPP